MRFIIKTMHWPNISVTILIQDRQLFEPGSGSKGIDPVFLLFLKAHNVHDKDLHY